MDTENTTPEAVESEDLGTQMAEGVEAEAPVEADGEDLEVAE